MTIAEQQRYIKEANVTESKYNLPKNILVGIMKTESNFNSRAVSKAGAKGLMQFMPGAAKDFGIDPFNASQSIEAAGKYLSQLQKQTGNMDDALRAYNFGIGNIKKWKAGKKELPQQTASYVGKVYKNANIKYTPTQQQYKGQTPISDEAIANYEQQLTSNFKEFDIKNSMPTFDTPIIAEEEPQKEDKDIAEVEQKTKEQNFLDEYGKSLAEQKQVAPPPQGDQQEYSQPTSNLVDIYNNVSSFVDSDIAQQGTKIGNLNTSQVVDIETQREWLNSWNSNREVNGVKLNNNASTPFSNDIYIDDLSYTDNGGNLITPSGEFDTVTNRIIFDKNYQDRAGIATHEFSHRFQKDLKKGNNENYKKYITEPISKLTSSKTLTPYREDSEENHAEINRFRYNNGLKPTQVITPEDVEKYNFKGYNLEHFNKDEILELLNKTADNSKVSDNYYAQQGKVIKDQQGQRKYPNQITEIQGNTMATDGYGNISLLVKPNVGRSQIIEANSGEYKFEGATKFTEYPITEAEKLFLKEINKK
jgi:hypothetical protein